MFISTALAAAADAHHDVAFYAAPEFWVAVAFFAVVGFAARPVGRGIAAALDMRSEKIRLRLEEAARLRDEAQELLATYQRKQRDALKEAEAIVAHAKAEAERLQKAAAAELDESLKRREQQAMDRIAHAEAQALKEVRDTAVDVAIAATRRIIAESLSPAHAQALNDQALKELPGKLH